VVIVANSVEFRTHVTTDGETVPTMSFEVKVDPLEFRIDTVAEGVTAGAFIRKLIVTATGAPDPPSASCTTAFSVLNPAI
jgi:hypothetical protein